METVYSEILQQALQDNPNALLKVRRNLSHSPACSCPECTPVLVEIQWYGEDNPSETDPVPQSGVCGCGKPLTLAARGLLEIYGEYSLVNKWYNRCSCINSTSANNHA